MEHFGLEPSPEVINECALELLHSIKLGDEAAKRQIEQVVEASDGRRAVIRCAKFDCALLIDGSKLVNPLACELVKRCEKEVPEELR